MLWNTKAIDSICSSLPRAVLAALALAGVSAEAQQLVLDIQRDRAGRSTGFRSGVESGATLFFPGSRLDTGFELFATDGTAAGSQLLVDIRPGAHGSDPEALLAAGRVVWFTADDGSVGRELWISDGTTSGTRRVADIAAGPVASTPERLCALGTALLFVADDGVHGRELWLSDGTSSGTRLLVDLAPGPGHAAVDGLVRAGQRAVFAATDAQGHREVWSSDGTALGTTPITSFRNGARANPWQFVSTGALAFFVAHDGRHGEELWVSDGTAAGTRLVLDIAPGIPRPILEQLTAVGNEVCFSALHPSAGIEPWVSDGTAGGTRLIADIRTRGFGNSNPAGFAAHNGLVFFAANDDFDERELFVTDLATMTTQRLDVAPAGESSFPRPLGSAAQGFLFLASTRATGQELFVSDGTPSGTQIVRDLLPGPAHGVTSTVGFLGSAAFFSGWGGAVIGDELWATDGTSAGTRFVVDLSPTPSGSTLGSDPGDAAELASGALLFAATGPGGRELWLTDGTGGATRLVRDLEPGGADSRPRDLVALGDVAVFIAQTTTLGVEPWRSDGTSLGTFPLVDLEPGPNGSGPHDLVRLRDAALLLARSSRGFELWRSDGTGTGTQLVRSFGSGLARGFLTTASEQHAYFLALTPQEGAELWRTDGTSAGTRLIADVQPGAGSSFLSPEAGIQFQSVVLGERLLFAADDGTHGLELFVSDGTAAGTALLLDLHPGAASTSFHFGCVLGDHAYFFADVAGTGRELWRSDGTSAGTHLVHDVTPGPEGTLAFELIALDDRVLFNALRGEDRSELWSSDGTSTGTRLLRSSTARNRALRRVGTSGVATFLDEDPGRGLELWRTDGTPAGTSFAHEFHAGPENGGGILFATLARTALFAADDGIHGFEPWSVDLARLRAAFVGSYGSACPGTTALAPTLRANALPQPGSTSFALELASARAQSPAVLLLSPLRLSLPLGACELLVDPTTLALPSLTDGNGRARFALPLPAARWLRGATVHAQAAVLDPGSAGLDLALTRGLEILIGD